MKIKVMEKKKSMTGCLNIEKVSDLDSAELNKVFYWNSYTDASAGASQTELAQISMLEEYFMM